MSQALVVTLRVDELEQLVRKAVREEVAEKLGANELEQLTRAQIAEAFQVSGKHVLTMIRTQGLPVVRFGSDLRFPKAAVIAWLKERMQQPGVHAGKLRSALEALEGGDDGT